MTIIETERLLIQEWEPDDWLPFRRIASDPEVMRYIGTGVPWTDERTRQFVARQIENFNRYGFCMWKLVEKATGRLIGHCGLQYLGTTGEIEIGWWLARDCWGRGFATEAAKAALRYGFETLHLRRIVAIVQPDNQASINVTRKLGMKFEKYTTHAELGLANPEIALAFFSSEKIPMLNK